MTQEEIDEITADISEVAAAMITKALERQDLRIMAEVNPELLVAEIGAWLSDHTEPAT